MGLHIAEAMKTAEKLTRALAEPRRSPAAREILQADLQRVQTQLHSFRQSLPYGAQNNVSDNTGQPTCTKGHVFKKLRTNGGGKQCEICNDTIAMTTGIFGCKLCRPQRFMCERCHTS